MSLPDNKTDTMCVCEKRDSRPLQWEQLLRKFSETHKEECRNVSVDMPRIARNLKVFPTSSQYVGTWNMLGMSGRGTYTFPNGVVYEGEFEDGMFHGDGELQYPSGAVLRGKWQDGVMYERTLIFADGLHYSERHWRYCKNPDRRFTIEYDQGLQPAGASFLTADQPTREIPPGFYDTGDGFYDPKSKAVYNANELTSIVRSPHVQEKDWIIRNCRTAPELNIGPRKHLYEEWSKPNIEPRNIPVPSVLSRGATTPFVPDYDVTQSDRELEIKFNNFEDDSEGITSNDASSED